MIDMTAAESDRRLLLLADFLAKLPPERFDYEVWVGRDWKGAKDLHCGTTACALGWATAVPELQALGLKLIHNYSLAPHGGWVVNPKLGVKGPLYSGDDPSFRAAEVTFGLDPEESIYLFSPDNEPPAEYWFNGPDGFHSLPDGPPGTAKPLAVAKHIRRYVRARAKLRKAALKKVLVPA